MKENFNETTKSQFQIWENERKFQWNYEISVSNLNSTIQPLERFYIELNWIEYEHSAEENEMRENSERLIDGWDLIWPEIEKES